MLVDRVRDQFSAEAIHHGDKLLVESAKIEDATIDDDWLLVEFEGSQDATAQLILCEEEPLGDHIHVHCSCQNRRSKNLCAHLWAIVRLADNVKWCSDIRRGTTRLTLTKTLQDEDSEDCYPDEHHLNPSIINVAPDSAALNGLQSKSTYDWSRMIEQAQTDFQTANNPAHNITSLAEPNSMSEIVYLLTIGTGNYATKWHIEVFERKLRSNGVWNKSKRLTLNLFKARSLPYEEDVNLLSLLIKSDAAECSDYEDGDYYQNFGRQYTGSPSGKNRFTIPTELADYLLSLLTSTGRFYLEDPSSENSVGKPLTYNRDAQWSFALVIRPSLTTPGQYQVNGEFRRNQFSIDLREITHLLHGNLIIQNSVITNLAGLSKTDWYWAERLHRNGSLQISDNDLAPFLSAYSNLKYAPTISLPNIRDWELIQASPVPRLSVLGTNASPGPGLLSAQVCFDYDGRLISRKDPKTIWVDIDQKKIRQRQPRTEIEFFSELSQISDVQELPLINSNRADVSFPTTQLPIMVEDLSTKGWHIEAEGRRIYRSSEYSAGVSSGINWFDLKAQAKFGSEEIAMPQLLQALQRGQKFVTLSTGDLGLLPEAWIAKFVSLAKFGKVADGAIRFKPQQGALLEALLKQLPQVKLDANFNKLKQTLTQTTLATSIQPSSLFKGTLRNYQAEGLGWLSLLRHSGFGGCLADDMGLGKTIQVLAFLADQVSELPSLVVVPRSLVHNWISEAKHFCPTIRALDYSESKNRRNHDRIRSHDLIVITYGQLRQDIEEFRKIDFNYVILDEAQAIKNLDSTTSKSARLLKSKHRLALTGTPVENHLGELGAIFEFLNPEMLSSAFLKSIAKMNKKDRDAATKIISKALRPFILRRTKNEVLKDLPGKHEQTIYCDLEPDQRRQYDDLLDHYRRNISETIKKKGLNKSKIQVLEALLRLRQAACHPGLIDHSQSGASSAKLELLISKLHEVIDSGHKAIVFSQFTSMLSFVRSQLDKEEISYEYLDGSTRNREERINRFQQDPTISIFLISLKAGGVGLNLTAADYCFILDPWWNPAAESQAIDRIYRMGQSKPVFAYRIISRDTIEDKITDLQSKKRDLADSIFDTEASALSSLNMENLKKLMDLV